MKEQWCIPPDGSGEFVWKMEDVLEVYKRPHDPQRPVVALDEKPVQLLGDTRDPILAKPGELAKQDHEYKRNGTANIFCAFEPLGNWRRLTVTQRRTKLDFATFVKELIDTRYKHAVKVVLVMDNLNTHTPASLYDVPAGGGEAADREAGDPLHAQARLMAERGGDRTERGRPPDARADERRRGTRTSHRSHRVRP